MFPTTFHADEALRLANERLDGLRAERRSDRAARPTRHGRAGLLRTALSKAAAALREVDVTPLPRLLDYTYRP